MLISKSCVDSSRTISLVDTDRISLTEVLQRIMEGFFDLGAPAVDSDVVTRALVDTTPD